MRASTLVVGSLMFGPWALAAACGGEQTPPPSTPIVVEAPVASAKPEPVASVAPPPSAAPPPVASATPGTADDDDSMTARGNMWGEAIGDSFGAGGLGLTGTGGGGGDGGTIGLGNIGTLGHGSGQGFGRISSEHNQNPPTLRQGTTTVSGRLPPEVIQRIVRQNFGRYRLCYENGLRTNAKLGGRVAVVFVIDKSGAVKSARDGGSTLADAAVVACVVKGFKNLSFPQPDSGEVTVTYPIIFAPGDTAPAASGSTAPTKPPPPKK